MRTSHVAGWASDSPTPAQLKEFFAQIASGRVTGSKLQEFLRGGKQDGNSFTVTIDYNQTLEQMIATGRYDWKDGDINVKHFPLIGSGRFEIALELIHFNRVINTSDALKEIDQRGYCPGTIAELLALGAAQPELQQQFPIIALDSVWLSPDGRRRVALLGEDASERSLCLGWFEYDWYEYCRFLVVRK